MRVLKTKEHQVITHLIISANESFKAIQGIGEERKCLDCTLENLFKNHY